MSYESRQKKRRHKRSERTRRRTPESAARWFLTLARKPGRYDCCGDSFGRGGELVFRFEPRSTRCVRCAGREGIKYRLSMRYERTRKVPKGIA